jgi:hypothetical protein
MCGLEVSKSEYYSVKKDASLDHALSKKRVEARNSLYSFPYLQHKINIQLVEGS